MKQWISRITWGLFFYIIFLIATLPAHLVTAKLDLGKKLELGHVTGTIWSGKIDAVRIDDIILKTVNWDVNFSQILIGRIALDIQFGSPRKILEPQGTGQVRYSLNGLSLADVKIKLPADLIAAQISLPFPVEASGLVEADLAKVRLGEPVCSELNGDIKWQLAAVTAQKTNFNYGDLKAQLSCKNGKAVAKILGNPDILQLDIDAILNNLKSYSVNGYISLGAKADTNLRNVISFLGNPDKQGRYLIKFSQ